MARRAVIELDVLTSRAEDGLRDVGQGFERLRRRSSEDIRAVRRSLDGMGGAARTAGRRGANFNQILFSMGDAAQDAQFGFRGAANNIGFMAEQIVEASRTAGGARNVLKGLAGSLLGAGGVIVAIQALLILGPKILEFFAGMSTGAERSADEIAKVREQMRGLLNVVAAPELAESTPEQLQAALRTAGLQIADIRGQILAIQNEAQAMRGPGGVAPGDRQEFSDLLRQLQALRAEQQGVSDAAVVISQTLSERTTTLDRQNAFLSLGLELVQEQAEEVRGMTEAQQRAFELWKKTNAAIRERQAIMAGPELQGPQGPSIPTLFARGLRQGRVGGIAPTIGGPPPEAGAGGTARLDQAFLGLLEIGRQVDASLLTPLQEATSKVTLLRGHLLDLAAAGKTNTDGFRVLQKELRTATTEMEALGEASERVSETQMEIASALGAVAAATVTGATQQIPAIIATAIARVIAQALTRSGNPLLGLAIAPIAAAGAAALFDQFIPEFAQGVDDFSGGVALVGERGPELVTLPAGSNVITNANLERMGGAGNAAVVAAINEQTRRLERVERIVEVTQASEALGRNQVSFSKRLHA